MTPPDFVYDPELAPEFDLKSLLWAMWTFVDRTSALNLSPAQIAERLRFHQRVVDGVTYYRPLAAAADYITRPEQMVKRGRNELTDEYVDPFKVAADWKALQAELDTHLPAPVAPGTGDQVGGDFSSDLNFRGWG